MNTGGPALMSADIGAKKSSLVAMARPPTRADAKSAKSPKFCVLRLAASVMLVQSAYGKSRVRVVQVARHADRHDVSDLTVAVRFQGDYDESYTAGDNS